MIRLELSLDDLLRSRFAISPVGEAVEAVHAIANPSAAASHASWAREQTRMLPRVARGQDLRVGCKYSIR